MHAHWQWQPLNFKMFARITYNIVQSVGCWYFPHFIFGLARNCYQCYFVCVCVFDTQSKMCEFLLVGHALIGDKQTICSVFLCCFWMFVVFFFVFFFSYSPSTLGSFYTQLYWHYGKSFVFLFDRILTEVSRMQTDPNTWLWLSGNQVLSRW